MLNIKKKVWDEFSRKTGGEMTRGLLGLANTSVITWTYNDKEIKCDLGGGFYGNYSTSKTRIRVDNITNEGFENIERNSEIKEGLRELRSGKIFFIDGTVTIISNGIINKEDKLMKILDIGKRVVDLSIKTDR